MVPENPNNPPFPDPDLQQDLFICDVADAVLKDVMQHLEHPFYSLSKKPVTTVREYRHGDHWLRITPSVAGLATIYDKDILIYAISQLMSAQNNGQEINPSVRINTHDFLIFTSRGTGGKDYQALIEALERLRGTTISTNIRTGNQEQIRVFGLIDSGSVRRTFGLDGRLVSIDIVLSDWLINAIKADEVLTLNRDYFRLGKPYERRAYEIARKHCGRQKEWKIGLALLKKKMGATSQLKKFRYFIRELSRQDHLPDYTIELLDDEDQVLFRNRQLWWQKGSPVPEPRPRLASTETYERVKRYVPAGESVYGLENEWVQFWRDSGCPTLKSPDAAFIGFCRARYARTRPRRAKSERQP